MRLCLFLLLAGLIDATLTNLGIKCGIIEEGNPLMKLVISKSWLAFYMIKVLLPLFLAGLCYHESVQGEDTDTLYTASFFTFRSWPITWFGFYFI